MGSVSKESHLAKWWAHLDFPAGNSIPAHHFTEDVHFTRDVHISHELVRPNGFLSRQGLV